MLKDLQGKLKEQLSNEAYKAGNLDTGYHYILYNSGLFDTDREIKAVAGFALPEREKSIFVLADSKGKAALSDAQYHFISELSAKHNLPTKIVEV